MGYESIESIAEYPRQLSNFLWAGGGGWRGGGTRALWVGVYETPTSYIGQIFQQAKKKNHLVCIFAQILSEVCSNLPEYCTNLSENLPNFARIRYIGSIVFGGSVPSPPPPPPPSYTPLVEQIKPCTQYDIFHTPNSSNMI